MVARLSSSDFGDSIETYYAVIRLLDGGRLLVIASRFGHERVMKADGGMLG